MAISGATLIGLGAAFCTTIAYLPQVIKTWQTRSTKDISLNMFAVMVLGVALWLTYGVLIGDVPIIASNIVTLGLTSTILYLKLKHG